MLMLPASLGLMARRTTSDASEGKPASAIGSSAAPIKVIGCYGGGGTPGMAVRTPTAAVATAAANALATQ